MSGAERFLFEDFVLDLATREFRRGAELVPLEPQVFDLLVYVIRNRDRVVSKDDLIEAVWGGRIVSESSLTTRINAVRKALGDSGEEQRLIRTVARKGIRFVGTVREGEPVADPKPSDASPDRPALALPDKPSIAVLPFQNMSGDPEQEYFSDGMVEEIISALSQVKSFFVIARNSSFTYKGRSVDVRKVGRELGVRYVLEGSVRKAGNRVRISGQLIDAPSGAHIWSDRFDGNLEDVFALQDQVTASVIGAIEPSIRDAEIERTRRKGQENFGAYDCFLKGMHHHRVTTPDGNAEAQRWFLQAIDLDPNYAQALIYQAFTLYQSANSGWTDDRAGTLSECLRYSERALAADDKDAEVLALAAINIARNSDDVARGLRLLERALTIAPSSAKVVGWGGWIHLSAGNCSLAVECLEKALRWSPLMARAWHLRAGIGIARFFDRRFEEAIAILEGTVRDAPRWSTGHRFLAASYAHIGRLTEARAMVAELLNIDPNSSISRAGPQYRPHHIFLYHEGLRMAGLPE